MFLLDQLMTKWLEHKRLKVDLQRCVRTRNRFSSCDLCERACPVSAITLDRTGVKIDEGKCMDCMKCTVSCPTQVFEDEKYPSYFSEMANRDVISFSCEKNKKLGSHIHLACLAQLDLPLIIESMQHSKRITIQHDESLCMNCSKYDPNLQSYVLGVLNQCNTVMKAPKEVTFNESPTNEMEKFYSRRDLIFSFSKKVTTNVVTPFLPEEVHAINYRTSIHKGMRHKVYHHLLGKYNQEIKETLQTHYLNTIQLSLTEECDACQLCSKICPTKCLKFQENEEVLQAEFYQSDCNGCRSCIDTCQKQGIKEGPERLLLKDFLSNDKKILRTFHYKECKHCGEKHLKQNELCEECELDQKRFG